ncbi:MAG: carboxypeptidase regulatory-like domain-containing protein [Anaerolineales bacterium]|nr:carboxypeptidase regulatory-like domain-containing protein [Anaerolineales bacterium]
MKHFLVLIISLWLVLSACNGSAEEIVGVVLDDSGQPVAGAVVRVQTTENFTVSDEDGRFFVTNVPRGEEFFITAWQRGYFIAGVPAQSGDSGVEIELHAHTSEDNLDYEWLPSQFHPGQGEDQGCAACHSSAGTEDTTALPVDEWLLDAHSQSAKNLRFITMYNGTDVFGNQSPLTRFASSRDYGSFPLPPDLTKPYFGPGYKLDFPVSDGNCAACHTPAASVNDPYGVNPAAVEGVAVEGVACDFCHKIWDVKIDPVTQMPYLNMPGVLSYEFRRPPEGHQFFAGPFDDVAPGEDTYSSLQRESAFCAPCHHAVFWDTVVYNSYGEWLESPYSDPEDGQTCQDCHMPVGLADHFALAEAGGLVRDPQTIPSHKMLGVMDEAFMQQAVTMTVRADRNGDEIGVQVEIFNNNTGHHIPTDSPLRHLILVVEAFDAKEGILEQVSGPVVEVYAGTGNAEDGYYAGLPGKVYAKILEDLWTEISPSGSYWNPTRVVSDNRIAAMETASSTYGFTAPEEGAVTIKVRLIFRRAFIEMMDWKGWESPDILIAEYRVRLD